MYVKFFVLLYVYTLFFIELIYVFCLNKRQGVTSH